METADNWVFYPCNSSSPLRFDLNFYLRCPLLDISLDKIWGQGLEEIPYNKWWFLTKVVLVWTIPTCSDHLRGVIDIITMQTIPFPFSFSSTPPTTNFPQIWMKTEPILDLKEKVETIVTQLPYFWSRISERTALLSPCTIASCVHRPNDWLFFPLQWTIPLAVVQSIQKSIFLLRFRPIHELYSTNHHKHVDVYRWLYLLRLTARNTVVSVTIGRLLGDGAEFQWIVMQLDHVGSVQ